MSSPPLVQVFALCEALYEDTHVASLDLSFNNLNDTAAQALSRLIKVRGYMGGGRGAQSAGGRGSVPPH